MPIRYLSGLSVDSNVLVVDAVNDRVGIGTTAPATKLQIDGSGGTLAGTAAISFGDSNSNSSKNWAISNGASARGVDQIGALSISRSTASGGNPLTAGVEVARFTSAGFDVNGEVLVSPNTAGKNTFVLTTNASNDGRFLIKSDTTTKVDIQANGISYFNGGNVLINTTTDSGYKLDVNGTGRFSDQLNGLKVFFDAASYGSTYANNFIGGLGTFVYGSTSAIRFTRFAYNTGDQPGVELGFDVTNNNGVIAAGTQVLGAGLDFLTYNGTAWGSRLFISKLGAATFSSSVTATGGLFTSNLQTNGVLTIGNQSVAGNFCLQITPSTTTPISLQGILAGTGAANIVLQPSGGNVGIGTTAPDDKLTILGSSATTFQGGGIYNSHAYGNADKAESRFNLGKLEGASYQPMGAIGAFPEDNTNSGNGILAFYTRNSQSVTEKARITTGGNVLIGTTTDSGFKLDVNGTGRFSGNVGVGAGALSITGYSGKVLTIGNGTQTENAIEIYSSANSDTLLGDITWINAVSADADKRSVIIRANRTGANNSSSISFFTKNAGALGTRLTIFADGTATFSGAINAGLSIYVGGAQDTAMANIYNASNNIYYNQTGANAIQVPNTNTVNNGSIVITNTGGSGAYSIIGNAGPASGYGLYIQSQDRTAAQYYPLLLQPNGGNVGIGTTAPGTKLEITTADSATTVYPLSLTNPNNQAGDGGGAGIRFSTSSGPGGAGNEALKYSSIEAFDVNNFGSNSGLSFTVSNGYTKSKALVIDRLGNVGVGTTAPGIGGYVAGTTVLTMAQSAADKFSVFQLSGNRGFGGNQNGNIDFVNTEGTATITSRISGINGANALDGQITFETRTSAGSLTERMRIAADGNVQIGDMSSGLTTKFFVGGDVVVSGVIRGNNVNAGTGGALKISASNTAIEQYIAFGSTPSGASGTAAFTERMRVLAGGNVLIGTTTDSGNRLRVVGGPTNLALGANGTAVEISGASGQTHLIGFDGTGAYQETAGSSSATRILRMQVFNGTNDYAQLFIDGANNYIYTSSNIKFGIGTATPSAQLHIKSGGAFVNSDANNRLIVERDSHAYMMFVSPNEFDQGLHFAKTTGIVGRIAYFHRAAGDSLNFSVNNEIRMTITSGGNVLIGTTTDGGFKLDVAGTFRASSSGIVSKIQTSTNATEVLQIFNSGGNSGSVSGVTHLGINFFAVGTNSPVRISAFQNSTSGFSGGMFFSTRSDNSDVAPTEKVRILSGGNVGIGTDVPDKKLVVYDASPDNGLRVTNSDGINMDVRSGATGGIVGTNSNHLLSFHTNNTERAQITAAGNFGIGNTPSYKLDVTGDVRINTGALGVNFAPSATDGRIDASNDIVAFNSSDERLKENITPITNALDKVKSLTGVEFDWKPEHKKAHGHEGRDTGIIAQQVLAVMPTAVRTNNTGFLAVRYEKLIGLLIEGMKEQQAQIDELKAQINDSSR